MKLFGLIDCNNFYVSCEQVFNPKLNNKAVVVLSNNDGCVVSRSNEAKALGIKMGEPYFEVRKRLKTPIIALSSNYTLYADLSHRVMKLLSEKCPEIEYYSIDEAFVRLEKFQKNFNLEKLIQNLRNYIKQCTGIPISIGVASTKTLAKVANKIAKSDESGICLLLDEEKVNHVLNGFPIESLWGIGRRLSQQLTAQRIFTAEQLRDSQAHFMREQFNVVMEKLIYELRGISCLDLEETLPKKSITVSRSFGKLMTNYKDIAEALSSYVEKACKRLRDQESLCSQILVFLETNRYNQNLPQRQVSQKLKLPFATSDTSYLITASQSILKNLFKSGYAYKKTGIILLEITGNYQTYLWSTRKNQNENLMKLMDEINTSFGKRALFFASSGTKPIESMRQACVSNRFTTHWNELLIVN